MAVSTRRGEIGREAEKEQEQEQERQEKARKEGLLRPSLHLQLWGRGHAELKRHHLKRALRLAPTPHMVRQLGPETAPLRFRQGHLRQRKYYASTPRHDTNRPLRNWRANRPAKTPGPCPGDRLRVTHACSGVRPALINALAPRALMWPALWPSSPIIPMRQVGDVCFFTASSPILLLVLSQTSNLPQKFKDPPVLLITRSWFQSLCNFQPLLLHCFTPSFCSIPL